MNTKSLIRHSRAFWPALLFCAVFAAVALVLRPVWPEHLVLDGPDGMPDFSFPGFARRFVNWAINGEAAPSHDGILKIFLPSLVWHEVGLCLSFALQALAMAAFLRELRLPRTACCCGAVAFALAGYNFTLFAAGHRGIFSMTPYAIFPFALAERAARHPNGKTAILAALCVIVGAAQQPDVMLLYCLPLAPWFIFRLVCAAREFSGGPKAFARSIAKPLARTVAIFAAALVIVGAVPFGTLARTALAGRTKQLEQTTGDEIADPAASARAKWIFATNWSLPPSETLEFVAPGLHGLDSGNPRGPYWGALGRSDGWGPNSPGFANYRQHSLYVGAIPCALALFAIASATTLRRRRAVISFFTIVAVVAWLLALGRAFPAFYRIFYAIPLCDKIRAPVKFVHIVEFSIAVLAAHGAAVVAQARREDFNAITRAAAFPLAGALALGLARVATHTAPDSATMESLGLGVPQALVAKLAAMHNAAFTHGALLFLLVAVLAATAPFISGALRGRAGAVIALALFAATALDQGAQATGYVTPIDISARLGSCPAATAVASRHNPPIGCSWSYLELTGAPMPEQRLLPFLTLDSHGIVRADPAATDLPDDPRVVSWKRLAYHPAKFWALWGVSSVFVPVDTAKAFVEAHQGTVSGLYDINRSNGALVVPKDLRAAPIAMLEPSRVPPAAAIFHDWREVGADPDAAFAAFAAPDFDPMLTVAVSGPIPSDAGNPHPGAPATPVKWIAWPGQDCSPVRLELETDSQEAGLLAVRDFSIGKFMPRVKARVDDVVCSPLVANGAFMAVPVSAGKHRVVIAPDVPARTIILPAACTLAFLFLLAAWIRDSAACTEKLT